MRAWPLLAVGALLSGCAGPTTLEEAGVFPSVETYPVSLSRPLHIGAPGMRELVLHAEDGFYIRHHNAPFLLLMPRGGNPALDCEPASGAGAFVGIYDTVGTGMFPPGDYRLVVDVPALGAWVLFGHGAPDPPHRGGLVPPRLGPEVTNRVIFTPYPSVGTDNGSASAVRYAPFTPAIHTDPAPIPTSVDANAGFHAPDDSLVVVAIRVVADRVVGPWEIRTHIRNDRNHFCGIARSEGNDPNHDLSGEGWTEAAQLQVLHGAGSDAHFDGYFTAVAATEVRVQSSGAVITGLW